MFTLRASFLSVVSRKIVPYHGSARIPRLTLWLFVYYSKSLKSPGLQKILEKSLNSTIRSWSPWIFPNIESEALQQSCIVKIRVFFRFNFVKEKTKKTNKKTVIKAKPNMSQNVSQHQIDQPLCIWVKILLPMPHGTGLTLQSWNVVLKRCVGVCFATKCWKVQF